ncbi:hypothetical protein [Mycoplasma parvum]|uniref:PBP domain-containing protein n=1 Tax=Mycoplasma parvum str. Indiana TaxID=1403316 RepID=U5NCM9_9MOLU|nr:hypothetical protein [Mycoplasma parvum]AGX89182.1 hypothetical protein PRV_02220 [Mycoplasma parvum str. Indiana]
MLLKTKWVTGIVVTFGLQGILIPLLNKNDRGIKNITVAGSSSLFDLFETLSDSVDNKGYPEIDLSKVDLVLLPVGSDSGRSSLKKGEIDLSLVSTENDETIYGHSSYSFLEKVLNVLINYKDFFKEEKIKEWKLSKDIVTFLVFHKEGSCFDNSDHGGERQWGRTHSNDAIAIVTNGEKKQTKGNYWLKNWFLSDNHFLGCFDIWNGFSREGGLKRSSINKLVVNYEKERDFNHLKIKEIPENNYLALEFLRREANKNSLFVFPNSYFRINQYYFKHFGFRNTGLTSSQGRKLSFGIEKGKIQNDYVKKAWINSLLSNSPNKFNNFHLNQHKTFFYDENLLCLKEFSLKAQEVHKITGNGSDIVKKDSLKRECIEIKD